MPRSTNVWRSGSEQKRQLTMLRGPPTQGGVHLAGGEQVLQMVDALEARPLAVLEHHSGATVGGVEFLRSPAGIPLRLEIREHAVDLAEVHPVAPRVGSPVLRVLDARAGDDLLDDPGQLADPIVLL